MSHSENTSQETMEENSDPLGPSYNREVMFQKLSKAKPYIVHR